MVTPVSFRDVMKLMLTCQECAAIQYLTIMSLEVFASSAPDKLVLCVYEWMLI